VAYISGSLFVASHPGHQIYEVLLPSGKVRLLAGDGEAGRVDGPNLTSRFNTPNGVARSTQGDELYINEAGGAVRAIDLTFKRPKKPKSVKVRRKKSGAVKVSWTYKGRNVESFRIEARGESSGYEAVAEVGSGARLKATLRGLDKEAAYDLRVVAVNPSGERASKSVSVETVK
jgi:hypothetical protein